MRYLVIFFVLFSFISCDRYIELPENRDLNYIELKEPVFSLQNGAKVKSGTVLTISASDSQAVVLFTLDGSKPDINNYASAGNSRVTHAVLTDMSITAVVYKNGYYSKTRSIMISVE